MMPDEQMGRLLDDFRDRGVPDGPPPEVVARTLTALRQNEANRRPNAPLIQRIRTMPPFFRIAAGLLAAAGITGLVAVETSGRRGPGVAFAQAIENVRAARTMTYTMTIGDDPAPFLVSRMEPGLVRTEMPGNAVSIIDRAAGKTLVLNREGKLATLVAIKGKAAQGGRVEDQIDQLRDFRGKPEDNLGERVIDGRPARGYHVAAGGWASDVWVDAATNLPTRMQSTISIGAGPKTVICSNFVFDPPLDPTLFQMTPPEGYTLQSVSTDIGAAPPAEKDLVDLFGDYAKKSGGRFPNDLQMPSLIDVLGELEVTKDGFDEATSAWIAKIGRGVGLVWAMPPDAEAKYTGKDVKLGQAEAPIFRYRPKGSATYRVIYGDLSVKDVGPARFGK